MNETLIMTATPAAEPITIDEAREFARELESADAVLNRLIPAAREFVETALGFQLVTAEYRLSMPAFPDCGMPIPLPRGPVQSVDLVQFLDTDGNPVTLAAGVDYVASGIGDVRSRCAFLHPVNSAWPRNVRPLPESVTIETTNGFGGPGDVPFMIRAAISSLVAYWSEERVPAWDRTLRESPLHVSRMLNQAKSWQVAQ